MKNEKRGLCVYGAGGHAKVVIELAEKLGIPIKGIVDSKPELDYFLGYSVDRNFEFDEQRWVIAIGNNSIRKAISQKLYGTFTILIHPSVNLSSRARVCEGSVIMAGVTVNSEAIIGRHCIINTNSSIDHGCVIGDYVHISPNVALAGDVYVGEGTHIGIGACVIQGVKIGSNCVIGAGAVVLKSIGNNQVFVGNPAKRLIK